MKLDNAFTDKFVEVLKNKRARFCSDTLAFVDKVKPTVYRIGTKRNYFGNEENLKNIIRQLILDDVCYTYTKNRIGFKPVGLMPASIKYDPPYPDNDFTAIEEKGIAEYWQLPEKEKQYQSLAEFEPFVEVIVDKDESRQYFTGMFLLNVDAWLKYYRQLMETFFSAYKFDIKRSSRVLRFSKEIKAGLTLCLEYDERAMRIALERGKFDWVDITVTVVNDAFKRNVARKEYTSATHPDIKNIALGKHPVFGIPCTTPQTVAARTTSTVNAETGIHQVQSIYWEYLPDNMVRLYNKPETGELIKRHCFYYMDIYSYYLQPYLNFIESGLAEVEAE